MDINNKPLSAGWNFDNSYAALPDMLYTKMSPKPVRAPKLVVLNERLAESLGLNAEALRSDDAADVFAGNRIPEDAEPLAQAYAGHQFGHFNRLGDGRALLIGEQITPSGERFDIQLKGSGRTPYSRGGDGRAALGPMLREYIISEAMHALGIPSTRSLAVVTTGEPIQREKELPGAILTRVAASHIRVGTFQYAAAWGGAEELRKLTDYTLLRHFPEAAANGEVGGEGKDSARGSSLLLLNEVIRRQAKLIAQWQLVGFIHGVMNTDNMALSGETIDYGPCAFMDVYDPATVFSSIDSNGRYAYGNQPQIALWNLSRFAETLLPLLDDEEERAISIAEQALGEFGVQYHEHWLRGMRAKLGISNAEEQDEELVQDLLVLMQKHRADYTNTFRALAEDEPEKTSLYEIEEFQRWQERWQARLDRQVASREEARQMMRSSNPTVIPRNHRVEEALEAAAERGDYSVMERLLAVLAQPYAHSAEQAPYCTLPDPSGLPYRTFCGT